MQLPILLFLAMLGALANATCMNSTLPRFHVTLTPHVDAASGHLQGRVELGGKFRANDTLVLLPITIASRPSVNISGDGIEAFDQLGRLHLDAQEAVGPYGLPTRFWKTRRATEGIITYNFTAQTTRPENLTANVGPLFEVRRNGEGILGSFWALLPVPDPSTGAQYNIKLSWILSNEQSAAWTWGNGAGSHSHGFFGTLDRFIQTWFAVGKVYGYPDDPSISNGDFGIYWLEEPPFNISSTAMFLQELFVYSTDFWQDTSNEPYRVFIRHNEETGSGGTALLRSFMTGWSERNGILSDDARRKLLAHEMTHNWTPMAGGTTAEQSRYNEGLAEYYSLRLLWRSGVINASDYLRSMNERALEYYTNPTVSLSDEEAMDIAWTQREAQRIPYGRGMIHFTNLDGQMRARYNGTRSLDTVALEFLNACRAGETCDKDLLFSLLREQLGNAAIDEWSRVSTGSPLLEPQANSLGPCFDTMHYQNNSINAVVWQWKAKQGVDISSRSCLI